MIPVHRFLLLSLLTGALAVAGQAHDNRQPARQYFIDVHELGAGKVTAAAVAEAHRKDLAVEKKHGVHFIEYWIDAPTGRVYCLSEAPNADAIAAAHREAHGLVPARTMAVTTSVQKYAGQRMFLTIDPLDANSMPSPVAEMTREKLATEDRFGVSLIDAWTDQAGGSFLCLCGAPTADAVRRTLRETSNLAPRTIANASSGR